MYKLKYYYLTKEKKEKLKKEFINTEYGKNLTKRLDRLFIIGICSFLFSIYLFISNKNIWDIITGIILLISSLLFTIGSHKIRIKNLNIFLIKNTKK